MRTFIKMSRLEMERLLVNGAAEFNMESKNHINIPAHKIAINKANAKQLAKWVTECYNSDEIQVIPDKDLEDPQEVDAYKLYDFVTTHEFLGEA